MHSGHFAADLHSRFDSNTCEQSRELRIFSKKNLFSRLIIYLIRYFKYIFDSISTFESICFVFNTLEEQDGLVVKTPAYRSEGPRFLSPAFCAAVIAVA